MTSCPADRPKESLASAAWRNGDLEEGHRRYVACAANLERAGYISDVVGCTISLADIRISQGRLMEAMATYEQGLGRATPPGGPVVRGAADMHTGMAEIFLERNELDAAAKPSGYQCGAGRPRLLSSRTRTAGGSPWPASAWREGDLDAALGLLDEADRQYVSHFLPQVRPVAALRARRAGSGRAGRPRPLRWASDAGPVGRRRSRLPARVRAHHPRPGAAGSVDARTRPYARARPRDSLMRLLRAADDGSRIGSVIEILVLQALERAAPRRRGAALVRAGTGPDPRRAGGLRSDVRR